MTDCQDLSVIFPPRLFGLMALTLFPGLAWSLDSLDEQMFLGEMPSVLTVSRLVQPQREAPAMVTVIDRRVIEASGFTHIPDLLRLVPGFQVSYRHNWQPVVTYHGISDPFSRRLQVLVDGRSIFNPAFGQVDWRELPLAMEDIERIEVVHGPSAAAYGSNAFLATINIITLGGGDDPGTLLAVRHGNRSQSSQLVRHSGRQGDLAYRVTLANRRDRLFDAADPDLARDQFINARFDYQVNARDGLMLQVGASRSDWDIGEAGDLVTPPRAIENGNNFVQLSWQRLEGGGKEYSLQYTRSQKVLDDAWSVPFSALNLPNPYAGLLANAFLPVSLSYEVTRQQLELQASTPVASQGRAVYGGEIRNDRVQSAGYFAPGAAIDETMYRLFGTLEWRVDEQWLFNIGGMLEDHYYADTTFSPRASVHYLPSPEHAFRASLNRGYRSQTFVEEVGNWKVDYTLPAPFNQTVIVDQFIIPSPSLRPERVDSAEVGYVGSFLASRVHLNARLFHDRYRDLIQGNDVAFVDVGGQKALQFINMIDMRMWGAEYQVQWQPMSATRILFGQALIRQSAQTWINTNKARTEAGRYEISAPRLSHSLLLMQDFGQGWRGSLGYYRVGRMHWLAEGDLIDSQDRLDARIGKTWRVGQQSYELALTWQGLSGGYYEFENDPRREVKQRGFVTFRAWF